MRYLIALCLVVLLIVIALIMGCAPARAGTINLPSGPYCATTQAGAVYNGVTAGVCVTQPPDVVPAGRQVVGAIKYPNSPGSGVRNAMDLTKWGSLFGHRNSTDAEAKWPGAVNPVPAITAFTGAGYVASCFTPTMRAQVTIGVSTYYGWLLDGAWSTRPGDFSGNVPGNLPSACAGTKGAGDSFPKMSTDPAWAGCHFPVGTPQVCLNLKMHTPIATSPTVALFQTATVFGP